MTRTRQYLCQIPMQNMLYSEPQNLPMFNIEKLLTSNSLRRTSQTIPRAGQQHGVEMVADGSPLLWRELGGDCEV